MRLNLINKLVGMQKNFCDRKYLAEIFGKFVRLKRWEIEFDHDCGQLHKLRKGLVHPKMKISLCFTHPKAS